jgi:hypothetical protein
VSLDARFFGKRLSVVKTPASVWDYRKMKSRSVTVSLTARDDLLESPNFWLTG